MLLQREHTEILKEQNCQAAADRNILMQQQQELLHQQQQQEQLQQQANQTQQMLQLLTALVKKHKVPYATYFPLPLSYGGGVSGSAVTAVQASVVILQIHFKWRGRTIKVTASLAAINARMAVGKQSTNNVQPGHRLQKNLLVLREIQESKHLQGFAKLPLDTLTNLAHFSVEGLSVVLQSGSGADKAQLVVHG